MTDELSRLKEATRVRINALALQELRATLRAMDATSGSRSQQLAAGGLRLLLEMYDLVCEATK